MASKSVASKQDLNIQLARDAYDAIAKTDIDWLVAHTHPDVEFQQGGRFPTAGVFHGRDAMFGHFMEFMGMVEGQMSLDVKDIAAGDERVAAWITATVGYKGKQLSFDEVHLWRVADGLLVELRAIPYDPYVVDEFFAS